MAFPSYRSCFGSVLEAPALPAQLNRDAIWMRRIAGYAIQLDERDLPIEPD